LTSATATAWTDNASSQARRKASSFTRSPWTPDSALYRQPVMVTRLRQFANWPVGIAPTRNTFNGFQKTPTRPRLGNFRFCRALLGCSNHRRIVAVGGRIVHARIERITLNCLLRGYSLVVLGQVDPFQVVGCRRFRRPTCSRSRSWDRKRLRRGNFGGPFASPGLGVPVRAGVATTAGL
jgi:hypothetical protein